MTKITNDEVNKVMIALYEGWGSSTGYLFGLTPQHKDIVKAIVKTVMIINRKKVN